MTTVSERESRRALASKGRVTLLDVLRVVGWPVTVGEAGGGVGPHTNSARSDLDLLVSVESAEVLTQERTQPGRPKVFYRATPETASPIAADDYRGFASLLTEGPASTARRTPCVRPGRRGAAGSGSTRDGRCRQLTAHRPW